MKIKQIISYQIKTSNSKKNAVIVVETAELESGNTYLIADLYSKGSRIYRMIMCKDNYIHYDYSRDFTERKNIYNNPYRHLIRDAYMTLMDKKIFKAYIADKNIKVYGERALDYIEAIEGRIDRIKSEQEKERQQREMNKLFDMLPDIPERLEDAIELHADKKNIICYKRHGDYADYMCCQCGEEYTQRIRYGGDYPIQIYPVPGAGDAMTCPRCGKSALLKPIGRMKSVADNFCAALYQVAADKTLIARLYYTTVSRSAYGARNITTREIQRVFLKPGKVRCYWKGYYHQEWIKAQGISFSTIDYLINVDENVVKESCMRYIPHGLITMLNSSDSNYTERNMHRLQVLESFARCPQLETLYKNSFNKICISILYHRGRTREIKKSEKELHKILGITKEQLRWLCTKEASFGLLKMIHFADEHNIPVSQYDMLGDLYISPDLAEKVLKYQSLHKLHNYISKNAKDYRGSLTGTFREYVDYLTEREAEGADLTNSVYLRPRNLHDTYIQVRIEAEQRRNENYINDMQKKYPEIARRSEKIPKKYTWEEDGLIIRPAIDAMEIVMEGRILHHCVGSDSQRYLSNYNKGKAWIMVLRHKDSPCEPYITIELQDNRIVQWYGKNDGKPDEETIEAFLKKYIEHVKAVKKTA